MERYENFIQYKSPDLAGGKVQTLDQLRVIARESWDLVTEEELLDLISSMPAWCQAVLEDNDGSKYYLSNQLFCNISRNN